MQHTDVEVLRRAAEQGGLVSLTDLAELGLTARQRRYRLGTGLLVPVQPAVYATAATRPTWRQEVRAATMAAAPVVAASHRCAASLWGLRGARPSGSPEADAPVEVTVSGTFRPVLRRVRVHRSRILDDSDISRIDGIPVTRPERTVIDAAGRVGLAAATSMLESAVHLGLTTPDHLWIYLSRYGGPGVRGSRRIRRLLAERDPASPATESSLEDLAVRVLHRAGVAPMVRQHPLVGTEGQKVRIDLCRPDLRFALEVDSARWHSDSHRYRADRAKWNLLTTLGWTLFIATEFDLRERPEAMAADVAAVLARLRRP